MASLRKPESCSSCPSRILLRKFKPERWECLSCHTVVASRPQRNDPNICRGCGAKRGTKPFHGKKNQCNDCYNEYLRNWRKNNPEKWRAWKSTHRKALQRNVRRAIQKTHKSFLTYLMSNLTKVSRKHKTRSYRTLSPKRLAILSDVQIDRNFLLALYDQQHGCCALSRLPMTHRLNDLYAISVDRIDSEKGYVPDNIQLVCKWVNLGKGSKNNSDFRRLLLELQKAPHIAVENGLTDDGSTIYAFTKILIDALVDEFWSLTLKIVAGITTRGIYVTMYAEQASGMTVIYSSNYINIEMMVDGEIKVYRTDVTSTWKKKQMDGYDDTMNEVIDVFTGSIADPGAVEKIVACVEEAVPLLIASNEGMLK